MLETPRDDIPSLIRKVDKLMNMSIPTTVKGLLNGGVNHARNIAPMKSGGLIQGIELSPSRDKGRFVAGGSIISRTPPNIKNNNPHNEPYHIYLEYGPTVMIRNGRTQRYMKATADWLQERAAKEVAKTLRETLK